MSTKTKKREERKWKLYISLLFILMLVSMLIYVVVVTNVFDKLVGKATSNYEVTDTSFEIDRESYKYAILKGFITTEESKIKWFYYPAESDTVLKENILQAEGVSLDADIALAKIVTLSNWKHPCLHEILFVLEVMFTFVIQIPFCYAIAKLQDEKLKKGESQKEV